MSEEPNLLQTSLTVINKETQLMKRCLATRGKLMDALKHASNFLSELRTSQLTPKQYYELYMATFDSLQILATFLKENHPRHHLSDLYELVQYAGNIIPRLYLMITVGTVYMTVPDAPVREIMKDMLEMCKGVQYPIRGLFLRYYLIQRTKLDLSMNGDEIDKEGMKFIVLNFIEMNKLWVRLQHSGPSRDREKRVQERQDLRVLVGFNLVRISQLEGLTLDYYKEEILPLILEQVIQCRDVLAQEYLLDVVIQVFPDEFHLKTLEMFFECLGKLNQNNDNGFNQVFVSLVDRLIGFVKREEPETVKVLINFDLFGRLWKFINSIDIMFISAKDLNLILEAIAKLSLTVFPRNYSNIDLILSYPLEKSNDLKIDDEQNNFLGLLRLPILFFKEKPSKILKLGNYAKLLNSQPYKVTKTVSLQILDTIVSTQYRITKMETLTGLFELLSVLITDKDQSKGQNMLQFHTEQEKLAQISHLIVSNKDIQRHSKLLTLAKTLFSSGNIKFTYPSLFFAILKCIRRHPDSTQTNTLFKTASRLINELYRLGLYELSFKLHLTAAQLADQVHLEEISYEFFSQCFTIFEDSLSDSKTQYQSLIAVISVLQTTRSFSRDNYDTLITKSALYGSKLLKKPDQCRAVYLASHLWWGVEIPSIGEEEGVTEFYRDGKRVLECLQRSLRVADACMDSVVSIELFVEILNRCLYYFIHGCEEVGVRYINGLIELIESNLDGLEEDVNADGVKSHFKRSLTYIRSQREIDERFQLIKWN
ncbi:hypothetical protein WICPIJ_007254 [Wickerhamomyces pijperi]|uniref:Vacuolar protein sorting-associated protein 35 n=1 Tax=Wickerhamomyces pijperi TaxID=599730 RepID=A0A9P8TK68_WICPI|nr:hypothetical protein WICPIJ_007254 [Wickerhamomyces pijperi]